MQQDHPIERLESQRGGADIAGVFRSRVPRSLAGCPSLRCIYLCVFGLGEVVMGCSSQILAHNVTMGSVKENQQYEIPTHCKAGVVVNEGPDFHVEVQMVPVPEPGMKQTTKIHCRERH